MTTTRVYGPTSNYNQCGDDSEYEVGSVYVDDAGRETEIVYYVIFTAGHPTADDDSWGVMCQTYTATRDENGNPQDENYDYGWGSVLCYWSFEDAKRQADTLAAFDESDWLDFCITLTTE